MYFGRRPTPTPRSWPRIGVDVPSPEDGVVGSGFVGGPRSGSGMTGVWWGSGCRRHTGVDSSTALRMTFGGSGTTGVWSGSLDSRTTWNLSRERKGTFETGSFQARLMVPTIGRSLQLYTAGPNQPERTVTTRLCRRSPTGFLSSLWCRPPTRGISSRRLRRGRRCCRCRACRPICGPSRPRRLTIRRRRCLLL